MRRFAGMGYKTPDQGPAPSRRGAIRKRHPRRTITSQYLGPNSITHAWHPAFSHAIIVAWRPMGVPPAFPQFPGKSDFSASKSCVCNARRLLTLRLLTEGL